jgi:hypothetical protein
VQHTFLNVVQNGVKQDVPLEACGLPNVNSRSSNKLAKFTSEFLHFFLLVDCKEKIVTLYAGFFFLLLILISHSTTTHLITMGTPSSELAAKLERRRLASEGGLVLASGPGVAAPGVAASAAAPAPGVAAPGASATRPSISVAVAPGGPSVSVPVPKAPVGKALSSTAIEVDTQGMFCLTKKNMSFNKWFFFLFWFHRLHGVLKTQAWSAYLEPLRWNTTSQGCGVYSGL